MQVTHDYHGVPLWLMKEYLVDLGAEEVEGRCGERWARRERDGGS